ncbi:MAG: response regulator [Acidobacteriia bacterium]|nr:response regulator [Terriglobia bacterium]
MSHSSEIAGKPPAPKVAATGVGTPGDEVRQKLRRRVDALLGECSRIAIQRQQAPVGHEIPTAPGTTVLAEKPAAPPTPERAPAPRADRRALVVEGNPLHRKVLVRSLEKSGYQVDAIESARDAIETFQRCPYAIVLLDCDTPEIDGFRTAASLRLIEGTARHTPIVGLTGNAGPAHRRERKAAGFDNYLLKPFRRDKVESVVGQYAPTRTAGAPSQLRALDKDRIRELQELTCGDDVLMQELIDLFLSSAPEMLGQMRHAAEDEDTAALRRAAHTLKGSSGQMGALRMQEICGIIEGLTSTGSLVGVDLLLTELSVGFERAVGELRLLRTEADAPSDSNEAQAARPQKTGAKTNEILVAEDDMLIARFLTSSLTAAGFRVTHVKDGPSALEAVRTHNYAVVILDINMPEVDGYQVLSEIRTMTGENTPVTIISSRHQEEDILRAFDLGVDDYLTKPFNPSEVVARVRRLARQAARS